MRVRREPLCPQCGGSTYEQLDAHHSRCSDCGLGRTTQPLILQSSPASPPASATDAQPRAHMPDIAGRMQRGFASASFPAYGLDDRWQGTRWFGGVGSSGDEIYRLELAHGENPWDEESTQVRVEAVLPRKVFEDDNQNIAIEVDSFTRQQVNKFWMSTGTLPDEVRRAAFATDAEAGDPTAPWEEVHLPIDGAAVGFRLLGRDDYWVAQARLSGILLGIESQAWPLEQAGLVVIDDLSPYIAGSEIIAARGRKWFGV